MGATDYAFPGGELPEHPKMPMGMTVRQHYKAHITACLFNGIPAPEQAPLIAEAAGLIADALIVEDQRYSSQKENDI